MKIKKCPFCGSEAVVEKHRFGFELEANSYRVICIHCQCSSTSISTGFYMKFNGKNNCTVTTETAIKESIRRWNSRAV